ncbi:diacylglycerol kinase [Metarhizobium album]|uniref:Dihydrofolate reductase n=1 Tax=Metarhizobium album TaxID=2182425 RepID=A0A2U2DM73_9HYPH|nr:dihydrofolate reductase [Rhizobium album]PWE54414.1 diacylglycerol kinase [Rhizobium album]
MSSIPISIVVAVSENGIIGRDGDMPWRLSTDLMRFKALTLGKPVIMGRKTLQSIGRPLPGRPNIVITRDAGFVFPGVHVVHDIDAAIDLAGTLALDVGATEIAVIGGGEIYRQAIGRTDILYVTHVDHAVDGDTRFPAIDPGLWEKVSEEAVPAGERDSYATRFAIYRRRTREA